MNQNINLSPGRLKSSNVYYQKRTLTTVFCLVRLLLYAHWDINTTGNTKETKLPLQTCNFKYVEHRYKNTTKLMLLPLISQEKKNLFCKTILKTLVFKFVFMACNVPQGDGFGLERQLSDIKICTAVSYLYCCPVLES